MQGRVAFFSKSQQQKRVLPTVASAFNLECIMGGKWLRCSLMLGQAKPPEDVKFATKSRNNSTKHANVVAPSVHASLDAARVA